MTGNCHINFNFTPLIAYTDSDWTGIHFHMNKRRGIIRNLPVKDHIPSQETLGLPIGVSNCLSSIQNKQETKIIARVKAQVLSVHTQQVII